MNKEMRVCFCLSLLTLILLVLVVAYFESQQYAVSINHTV